MTSHYDLVVIGAGPAGEKAAAQAAYHGRRVAVVDRASRPGGAPVHSGGIPTKTLRETAEYLTGFRRREIYGLALDLTPSFTLERLRARAAEVQATAAAAVEANLERHGIELLRGEASLAGDQTVLVTGPGGETRRLSASTILVATGSRPFRPGGISFDDPDVHDSDTILRLDRIPGRLVVIGGGPVGAEYASIFTALGVHVTLVDGAGRLVSFLDEELSEGLAGAFMRMGMDLRLNSPDARIARRQGRLTVAVADGEELHPDKVLFAAGRVGNTEELGLAEAGVDTDDRGRILVDEHYRTSSPGVYAAGDVIGPPALASVSAEQGRVAACDAFGIPLRQTVDPLPPYGIYAIPEIAMVGMTERAAHDAGLSYVVGRSWFADNPRSRIAGTTEGLLKLVVDRRDGRLVGVHILGDEAAELIHQGQVAIHAGMGVRELIDATFNIPTRSEAYKYAAYAALEELEAS